MNIHHRIATLRRNAQNAGLKPVIVEVPFDDIDHTVGPGMLFGMEVRTEPGPLCVLALPSRRIGRYECIAPVRFEETA
jgi:hypothetical protein